LRRPVRLPLRRRVDWSRVPAIGSGGTGRAGTSAGPADPPHLAHLCRAPRGPVAGPDRHLLAIYGAWRTLSPNAEPPRGDLHARHIQRLQHAAPPPLGVEPADLERVMNCSAVFPGVSGEEEA